MMILMQPLLVDIAFVRQHYSVVFGVFTLLIIGVTLVQNASAQSGRGQASDHFDGKRFRNLDEGGDHGFFDVLRWQTGRLFGKRGAWSSYKNYPAGSVPPARVDSGNLRVTFVGHATTMLIQVGGVNILTDPVWSKRVSPLSFVGPKRVRPPGLRFEDLPPIHAVLVSHNHYDHLDIPTLKRLAETHQPRFFVGLGNNKLLKSKKIAGATELDWWQSAELPEGVRITLVPARHWSGRGIRDRNQTLWGGYVIESSSGTIYFAGDTGFGTHFERIAERFPTIRLALLPIGAHLPRWFMQQNHMSPEDAVRAHQLLRPKTSLGIHFGTFPLADEGERQPVEELRQALLGTSNSDFNVLAFGEGRDIP
ncbi:MAG: Outer membrane protein romA [uncultured Pyrinomonadaceae bacterium]|uniref:Outer membrane protein romA n=1 Tax=uncultured Pyrinomonadaceae bacterium TaxID=2283094 RepID=A0A6J4PF14_9BACT|nr:MAG: Outer membrane protein romA [uncultured Pyrinomonadaceae bacterium]